MEEEKKGEFHKIKKIICPNCGNLCLTKANKCIKCGEPLHFEINSK
ncbi:MAG: hypothetical protein GF311_13535 [Candidatus Lokiarchaeota archaeon]|nr:hypothetical protein [Candidatus Lokiarchaeota archaeon]